MEDNKYKKGEKICEKIFQKTGDPRFHNMMKGFEELNKQNSLEQQGVGREF